MKNTKTGDTLQTWVRIGVYGREEPKKIGLWLEFDGVLTGPITVEEVNNHIGTVDPETVRLGTM